MSSEAVIGVTAGGMMPWNCMTALVELRYGTVYGSRRARVTARVLHMTGPIRRRTVNGFAHCPEPRHSNHAPSQASLRRVWPGNGALRRYGPRSERRCRPDGP